jgi:two-component system, cell cycle sensor histidine kinase and response regulator CckA
VNARDAMPVGGKLIMETSNIDLSESTSVQFINEVRPGPYVMLSVSDTGVGMPKEVRERAFEPFFTTKPQGRGTGLGLSTVYGIVKQSGGYIWIYSEEGRGTTFKIYLPRVEEQATPAPAGAEEVVAGIQSGSILLVEDEPAVRDLGVRTLEWAGYRVLEAGSGEEALQLAGEHGDGIALLLTDLIMPNLGGHELAERLRQTHPDLRILFTSGYSAEAVAHHAPIGTESAFLQKPYTPEALIRKVRDVFGTPARGG